RIPQELSCSWDNDGLMCCADENVEVRHVLIALDVTDRVISEALERGCDVIVAHHPLIFSPIKAVNPRDLIAKRVIRLLQAGITVMCFHTRLDAVDGGVNDVLAGALGLTEVTSFGENGEEIGRIGTLPREISLLEFAGEVKRVTGATSVQVADAGRKVSRVAVLGGSGSGDVQAAILAGADTYVSGELKHNVLTEGPEMGINLVAAGHHHTENLVCKRLFELVAEMDGKISITVIDSNEVQTV
ncbi:MAG: Nif3-like dinuclear metal center hexameric protein, partial [Clostridia bacterium]|nr:Nif3-like dinuclear metal center hexameric protein [Clostridia bacterium]